jgi:hypothetical protein
MAVWENRGVRRRNKKREEKAEGKSGPKMGEKGSGMHIDKRWSKVDEAGEAVDNEDRVAFLRKLKLAPFDSLEA